MRTNSGQIRLCSYVSWYIVALWADTDVSEKPDTNIFDAGDYNATRCNNPKYNILI